MSQKNAKKHSKHSISIDAIYNFKTPQEITEIVTQFLNNAKRNKLTLSIIAPTDVILKKTYEMFKYEIEKERTNFYCLYEVNMKFLKALDFIQKQKDSEKTPEKEDANKNAQNAANQTCSESNDLTQKQKASEKTPEKEDANKNAQNAANQTNSESNNTEEILKIQYINEKGQNPLEKFIDSVEEEANRVRKKQEDAKKQDFSFFDDLEMLDFSSVVLPKTKNLNFNDISNKDSIGSQLMKIFFKDLVDLITKHCEIHIEDKNARSTKLKDIEERLFETRNEMLKNLQEACNKYDEKRTAALIAIKLGFAFLGFCVALAGGPLAVLLAIASGSLAVFEASSMQEEFEKLEQNKYYRIIVVPILRAFFKNVAYAVALCVIDFRVFMLLDSEGNFLDLSGINTAFFIDQTLCFKTTPLCNQIIKGRYNGGMQGVIEMLKSNKSKEEDMYKYSFMNISSLNIDATAPSPAYEFSKDLQESYVNLVYIAHPIFSSSILANSIKRKNMTSRSSKHYIILTPPADVYKAGSVESMMQELGIKIGGRPKPPMHEYEKTLDYSSYVHKDIDNNDLFLQISPFVKIPQQKEGEYEEILSEGDKSYLKGLMAESMEPDVASEVQLRLTKRRIMLYKEFFNSVAYEKKITPPSLPSWLPSSLSFLSEKTEYYYSPHSIISKAIVLYCLEYEEGIDIEKDSSTGNIYATAQHIKEVIYDNNKTVVFVRGQMRAEEVDLFDVKEQLKRAVEAYEKNQENEYSIKLGNNISHPFSCDETKLSFEFVNKIIKCSATAKNNMTAIGNTIEKNDVKEILLSSVQSAAQNTLTNFLPVTKIFFADTEAKKLEALAIISFTFGFALVHSITKGKKLTVSLVSAVMQNRRIAETPRFLQRVALETFRIICNQVMSSQNPRTNITAIDKLALKEIVKSLKISGVLGGGEAALACAVQLAFKTDTKKLFQEYENILLKLKKVYDSPLFAIRSNFFVYPMPVDSRMIIYNMSYGLFGGSLQSGGLEIAPSILLYAALKRATNNGSTNQTGLIKNMVANHILALIIPDELRGGLSDIEFYRNILSKTFSASELRQQYRMDASNKILENTLNEIKKSYELNQAQMTKQDLVADNNVNIIVDSYNVCIDYLANILDNIHKPTETRNFVKALKNIAKNNILAIYEGVHEKKEIECPKIFGRIATTIILENGLHLG